VTTRLSHEVGREAEHEPGDEGSGHTPRQPPRKEEGRPGRERRGRERRHVVREDGSERLAERRKQQARTGHGCYPREVDPVRGPDRVRHERVVSVDEPVRPPEKRPHEDRLVGKSVADDPALRMRDHASAQPRERQQRVSRKRKKRRAPGAGWPSLSYVDGRDTCALHSANANAMHRRLPGRRGRNRS